MQEKRVSVDGISLQVRDSEGEGEAIVFLHFSGANLMMWERALPHFAGRYRLVRIDLKGHGKSDRPDNGYGVDELAREVVEVLNHLHLVRAHIVGSSLGAEVGLSMAANDAGRVISLVCDGALSSEYGPYGLWEGTETEFKAHVSGQLDRLITKPDTTYPSVDALVAETREVFEGIGWWNEEVEAMERYGARALDDGTFVKSFSRRAMADYLQHYFRCRFEDYYRRTECPLLMVPGDDVWESERERTVMEALCALAPGAQIARIDEWNHPYGWLLDPDNVCEVVLAFIDGV